MYKDPITDRGKVSKKGHLTLEYDKGHFKTLQEGKGDPAKVKSKFATLVMKSVAMQLIGVI